MYHKWQSYDVWFLRYGVQRTQFFVILDCFFPLTTLKIKILKKWKNTWRYYHFTHVYHKWQSYDVWFLRYGAWRTEYFVILDHFLPFYLPKTPKNQNFEKIRKTPGWRYYHFTQKIMIICYTAPETWHVMDVIVIFHFALFLLFYGSNSPKNENLKKIKKILEISSFYTCVPKIMIKWCTVPEIWRSTDRRTEGRAGGRAEVTYGGGCPA